MKISVKTDRKEALMSLFKSLMILGITLISASGISNGQTFDPRRSDLNRMQVPITQNMELAVGKASIIRFDKPPIRVSLSNPGILYLLQISPTDWELIGRNPGTTNLFVWLEKDKVVGSEISVGLPVPPYLGKSKTMEIVNGGTSELIYIGHPSERINNAIPGRTSGLITDMPEPCLVPGCI